MGEHLSILIPDVLINTEWLYNNNPTEQLLCLKSIRKKLSLKDPDIEGILKLNIIPRILELMMTREDPECQIECTWILTNLASGYKHGVEAILKLKGTECLMKLIKKTPDINVKYQCFWALSNVACEDAKSRDHVLSLGVFHSLIAFIDQVDEQNNETVLKICVWALANFFLTKFPPLNESYCSKGLAVFFKCFRHSNKIVRKEAAFGISHIMENHQYINAIIESGILKDICKELEVEKDTKTLSCLTQIVGNVAFGNDFQTQHIIDNGFIPIFHKLLDTKNKVLVKEVVWILSNIAAGNHKQVKSIMDGEIFPKVIRVLNEDNFRIRREAVWTINNSTQNGECDVIIHLVKFEVLKYLTILLDDDNYEIVKACCDAIYNILLVGEVYFKNVNLFAVLVEKYGALKKIEHLQFHKSWNIVDKVISILESFYTKDVKEVPRVV